MRFFSSYALSTIGSAAVTVHATRISSAVAAKATNDYLFKGKRENIDNTCRQLFALEASPSFLKETPSLYRALVLFLSSDKTWQC